MESLNFIKTQDVGIFGSVPPKTISLLYQKIETVFYETITLKPSITFGDEQLLGTTLLSEKATFQKLDREVGVNCYAFAIGRVPSVKGGKDPVPGGNLIRKIRVEMLNRFPLFQTKINQSQELKKALPQTLPHKQLSLCFSLYADIFGLESAEQALMKFLEGFHSVNLEEFCRIYYSDKDFDPREVYRFLTEDYKIPPEEMKPEKISNLMQKDGLVKIYPLTESQIEHFENPEESFGNFLIAAFSKPGDDYHFIRFFNGGWYERHGEIVRKRPNAPQGIPMSENPLDVAKAFYPNFEKDFIGYFLVPTTVAVVDGIGRKFVFESRKI